MIEIKEHVSQTNVSVFISITNTNYIHIKYFDDIIVYIHNRLKKEKVNLYFTNSLNLEEDIDIEFLLNNSNINYQDWKGKFLVKKEDFKEFQEKLWLSDEDLQLFIKNRDDDEN